MGNKATKQNPSVYTTKYDYSEDDVIKLQKSFESLSDESKEHILEDSLTKLFPENPNLGSLFYSWMARHSPHGKVDFETYLGSMELILKSPYTYNFNQYSKISFEKYQILYAVVNYNDPLGKIEKVSAGEFVINIFHKSPSQNAEKAASSVTLGFLNDKDSISWSDFVYAVRKTFPQINTVVRTYFIGKLMDPSVLPKLPVMSDKSALLTSDYFALLFMSNPRYQKSEQIDLLYTTAKTGTSFNRLMYSIQGYEGPTYFLIEHYDSGENNYGIKKGESYIFGGYTNTTWSEQLGYQGDSDGFLFSLSPKYRPFFTQKGEKGKNYIYLNSKKIQNSKYKPGLGFGGEDFRNFRIWIDDEIETNSYASAEDNTYETGFLVNPSIRKFNIHTIEIWGTGGRKALEKQNDFRESENKIIEGQRKVDRKAFLSSGFDKEMFFSKTYAAANNRDDQTDFRAEMQKQDDMEKHK